MTKAEIARELRMSPRQIDLLRSRGELGFIKAGHKVLFSPEALQAYISARETKAGAARAAGEPAVAGENRRTNFGGH